MQVKLIPLAESGLEEINIHDQVFPIGRNHKPFQSYSPATIGQLSRRHARIFREDGRVFLVDTGSRNGTSLNGIKLDDQPVSISNGDLISFSDKLIYNVVVNDQEVPDPTVLIIDPEICLTLLPIDEVLEPIVISRYPFLVSKTDRVFAKFADKYAQDIRYLSRKHAYFSAKNAEVYIEDLGSTNGTYVNKVRLSEMAVTLKNGDTIGFGGKRFVYTIKIDINYPVREVNSNDSNNKIETRMRDSVDEQKTTFVASANSFLDIFCAQEEEAETPIDDEINPEEIESSGENLKPAKTAMGRFYRASRLFLQQAKAALAEDTVDKNRIRILRIVVAVLVLTIGVGIGLYWKGASKRNIQELMEVANYERSLEMANEYLKAHPEDEDIRRIATQSMLKDRVPQWVTFIDGQDYDKARQLITTDAEEDAANNEQNAELIAVLNWVGNLEKFVHSRGGMTAPLNIFQHEQSIIDLLEWWEKDEEGHRTSLRLIANSVPEFKPIHSRTFSDLRTLQNEQSVYLTAIEQLKTNIDEKLDSNRSEDLGPILEKFEKKYPRIQGMDQVRADWRSYLALEREIENKNLRGVIAVLSEYPLTIPLFREKFEQLATGKLPAPEFRELYAQSSEAWRNGNIDKALELLSRPGALAWREFAGPELERKQDIHERFKVLGNSLGTEQYGAELMEFYSLLDEQEDIYFLDAIRSEVSNHRRSVSVAAEKEMESALQAWNVYIANGRISGFQRLEPSISSTFKNQAKKLSNAYFHAARGVRYYQAASTEYAPHWKKLYDEILRETKLQRQYLNERGMVLKRATLNAKLKLIAKPSNSVTDDPTDP